LDDRDIEHLMARTPHLSREQVLQNQRFAEARKLYLDRFLEVYDGDPLFLVNLWASYDRGIAGGMYLHDLVYRAATGRRAAQ
jgi:hypothetical protein